MSGADALATAFKRADDVLIATVLELHHLLRRRKPNAKKASQQVSSPHLNNPSTTSQCLHALSSFMSIAIRESLTVLGVVELG